MSTKLEFTHRRPTYLSNWYKENLPDNNTGLTINDIDWIILNYKTKKFMLIEEKSNGADFTYSQSKVFPFLDNVIKEGIKAYDDYEYLGWHKIVFECYTFDDGKCYWDDQEITEQELILKLSI